MGCKIRKSSETKHDILVCDIRPVGRVGLSEESVQIREIQSILDGLFCVQGKEIAYGRKEGIAESG